MSSRPKLVARRSPSFSEADRMRALNALGNLACINPVHQGSAIPLSANYLNSSMSATSSSNNNSGPPPLPPRPESSRAVDRYNRYSGYNSFYSPYSRYSPGMYSAPYGGFRSPYTRYGVPAHDAYSSFIQLAEESTRPAFESIESVVDIVSSISMMLESTYHAVYSSYNAILGVVDQFSRLKDHLAEVLSCLALLRGLKYLCLKVLYLLRLRKDNPSVEAAWNTAKSVAVNSDLSSFHEDTKSPWPFFMFVGLVIGAPWLMFKLLSRSIKKNPYDVNTWVKKDGTIPSVRAAFDFQTNRRGELSFSADERLFIAPKNLQEKVPKGWLLASNRRKLVGLIPKNYLKNASSSKSSAASAVKKDDFQEFPKEVFEERTDENDPLMSSENVNSCENFPGPIEEETLKENDQN